MDINVNLKFLKNQLPQIAKKIEDVVDREIRKTTLQIEADAKIDAPVDTGFLRNSIQSQVSRLHGIVSVGAEYAPYVEYGTIHQDPQPFLEPAADKGIQHLQETLNKLESEL